MNAYPYDIQLADHSPIAEGGRQVVFQHPEFSNLLIKILKPTFKNPRLSRRYETWRHGIYRSWQREFTEYLAVLHRAEGYFSRLPYYSGICHTDLGMGFVVEKLMAPTGEMAPTLKDVLQSEDLTLAHLNSLREDFVNLMNEMRKYVVTYSDISSHNIVVTGPDMTHLVLIDGLGGRAWIPIKRFSQYAFDRSHHKYLRRVLTYFDQVQDARFGRDNPAD